MSVASLTRCPTIYEADLPTVSYEDAPTPRSRTSASSKRDCKGPSQWVRTGPRS